MIHLILCLSLIRKAGQEVQCVVVDIVLRNGVPEIDHLRIVSECNHPDVRKCLWEKCLWPANAVFAPCVPAVTS